jgi:hypothetical protein
LLRVVRVVQVRLVGTPPLLAPSLLTPRRERRGWCGTASHDPKAGHHTSADNVLRERGPPLRDGVVGASDTHLGRFCYVQARAKHPGRGALCGRGRRALSVSAQSAPLKRPYVKKADFVRDVDEFDFEGPTVLEVVFANMGAGGKVRICVSGVCRNVAARNRVVMSPDRFGQVWNYGQTRVVVIAACNRADACDPSA